MPRAKLPTQPGILTPGDIHYLAPASPTAEREAIAQAAEACFARWEGFATRLQRAHFLAQVAHETGEFRWMKELGDKRYLSHYDEGNRNYCGRGWLMTTWLKNYHAISIALGVDFVLCPELLRHYPHAADSSGYYWQSAAAGTIPAAAEADDLVGVTQKINGGQSHLGSRRKYLIKAKTIYGLSPGG